MSERKPAHTTNFPRKYIADKRYEAKDFLPIFGGGHFWPGTKFSATGHLGSMQHKPCRGKRHPIDLMIEIRKRRKCRQPNIFDTYWIAARLFDAQGLILRIRRKRKKEAVKQNIRREVDNIRRIAMSV